MTDTQTIPLRAPTPSRGLTLSTRIFAGTAAIVAAVLGVILLLTWRSANRTADQAVDRALRNTREIVGTKLSERGVALRRNAETFVIGSGFRSLVESKRTNDVLDQAQEAVDRTGADWVQITDAAGVRLAKSDEPGAPADTLSGSALIGTALEGKFATGYGNVTDTTLIQAVAVPIPGAGNQVIGTLMAAKALDNAFAASIKGNGDVDVVFFALDLQGKPHVAASTVGRGAEVAKLVADLAATPVKGDSASMRVEPVIAGQRFVALGSRLLNASGGPVGGVAVLRSRDREFAAFNQLRTIILFGFVAGLVIAGALSFGIARQVTRPVDQLVEATRRAADGDYSADITVRATGEIGTLADAFRAMLADLREKQSLVEFLSGPSDPAEARTVQIEAARRSMQLAAREAGVTPGSRFAIRYDVKELLGVGGMGSVFKAVDTELGDVVAIKTLKDEVLSRDPLALDRFKSEIRLARRISHRNVVRTHDLGEYGGVYFITMEYVEGKSLKQLIRERGRLPVPVTLSVAKQLCRALEVAHEQGVIHRDVKPHNMVVEPDGVLKVMDFGIARLATRTEGMTQAGMVVGTPEYMAPEQLMGGEIDARADIYSAGCVIYECLTGATPLSAENQYALIAKLLEETPVPPSTVNPEVPQALSDLVMRTLAKKPEERPQSATELHDLLAALG
ncbi:MAG: protein kinase [Gemmatimonadetes bacterium]|nr:protein kinase [Gemmatimonadota bacterium]